jgi:hypothetical protein
LLAAHAEFEAKETDVALSGPNTPSYARPNSAMVHGSAALEATAPAAAVAAAVGNQIRHSGPRRRCIRRSKRLIFRAASVQRLAFRCYDLDDREVA